MGLHPTKEQQEKALVSTMVHILSQVTTAWVNYWIPAHTKSPNDLY